MRKYGKHSLVYLISMSSILISCNQQESTLPERRNIEEAVFASGYTEQENMYTVSSKVDGIITMLSAREGDSLIKGDLVATIENDVQNNQLQDALIVYEDAKSNASTDSPQLRNIQAQIDQAEEELEFDRENYLRYEELWVKKSVSKLDFEKAELQFNASQNKLVAAKKNYEEVQNSLRLSVERSLTQVETQKTLLKDYKLLTEASGKLIKLFKKQGELVRRGEAVAIIGSGNYIIKLFVSEEDITKIDIGNPVSVNINTYPNKTFQAKVIKIHPGFDQMEQSYIVEAEFEHLPDKMFSGTQLQVNIETATRKDVLVIPTEYVTRGKFLLLENGKEIEIETGSKNSTWTEVISGVSEKDLIIKSKK